MTPQQEEKISNILIWVINGILLAFLIAGHLMQH